MPQKTPYQLAEEKIAEAHRTGATELELSSMKLTELPESIGQLTKLQKLDLGRDWEKGLSEINQLIELPESIGQLTQLQTLDISNNQLTELPESLWKLTQLKKLDLSHNEFAELPESLGLLMQLLQLNISHNQLTILPEAIGQLSQLLNLNLSANKLTKLPESLHQLTQLQSLYLGNNQKIILSSRLASLSHLSLLFIDRCQLTKLPDWLRHLSQLRKLDISHNQLTDLPNWLAQFTQLRYFDISLNNLTTLPDWLEQITWLESICISLDPLISPPEWLPDWLETFVENQGKSVGFADQAIDNPELLEAYRDSQHALITYTRLKIGPQITLNEAKLIMVGEGEVGKTCLMDALEGKGWQEHDTTHGIDIREIKASDPASGTELTLNGWDFGGQRVYRPTHQLFFSSPAVYLVVWKPREGPQQGFVKEWIKLIKHREPDAKILVVATHGGPGARQPDIDRQELWDLFGAETVLDFFFVDSKPDENGQRHGIAELKDAIARTAVQLPEVGRSVPKRWQDVRNLLEAHPSAYLPRQQVLELCAEQGMDADESQLFLTLEHRLGHLIHYAHDKALRDIVVLKPSWLATAISFVLDDKKTRDAHGLVPAARLSELWSDPTRDAANRYPPDLHPIFLRLMERFDLSYRVAGIHLNGNNETSLIAQLVPDNTPENLGDNWSPAPKTGDLQQMQICRIVDDKGQSATAEGLFYQLIVRLHKYSLGRDDFHASCHWQRGLILDDKYNGRAYLKHVGNDVHISVRAPYPERFLAMLTEEVRYLVDNFWEGLNCHVTVPCLNDGCIGLFEVSKLIENKRRNRLEQPCPICNEWQNISDLLHNAPAAAQPISLSTLQIEFAEIKDKLDDVNANVNAGTRRVLSKVDKAYDDIIRVFADEAKEGPRLFSIRPVDFESIDKLKSLTNYKLRVQLWCEHSQLPLFVLNAAGDTRGSYDLEMPREWVIKAAPYLNALNTTLGLVLPTAMSGLKFSTQYKDFENQLSLGKEAFAAIAKVGGNLGSWASDADVPDLPHGQMQRAEGAMLRELHVFLKREDITFGGLVRVMNKRDEFLWVHEQFEGEY